jgi:iron complex outermembrane receptor protein
MRTHGLHLLFMRSFITHTFSIFSLLVVIALPALASGDPANAFLSGKITDAKTGKPLAGAVIYLHEAKTGSVADENGAYKTPLVPAGKYLVEISFQGYSSILETIAITENASKNYALKETFIENEAVTVTGVASATKVRQSAQPVSIV